LNQWLCAGPLERKKRVPRLRSRVDSEGARRVGSFAASVARRLEVGRPCFDRAEEPRMAQADVGRAEAACGEPGDHATARRRDRRKVVVDERDVAVDECALERAGPLAVVVAVGPGGGEDGDEGPDRPGRDLPVGPGCEIRPGEILGRRAGHPVQEVDDGIAGGTSEAGRQVEVPGALRAGIDARQDHAARRAGG
jgi:hypothetical protein